MLRAAGRAVVDLIYPRGLACGLCGAEVEGAALCADCAKTLASQYPHRCPGCGRGMGSAGVCHMCRQYGAVADRAIAAYDYEGRVQSILIAFKFNDRTAYRDLLVSGMVDALRTAGVAAAVDCIVPVPMHWLRRFSRGYNQTALLASGLAETLGKPLVRGVLVRPVYTKPTARMPGSHAGRMENAVKSFQPGKGSLEGKTVLLVDDILTTGSTMRACAAILRGMGAAGVVSIVAAAVPEVTP